MASITKISAVKDARRLMELEKMRERIRRFNHLVEEYASAWTEKIRAEEQPEKEWYAKI